MLLTLPPARRQSLIGTAVVAVGAVGGYVFDEGALSLAVLCGLGILIAVLQQTLP